MTAREEVLARIRAAHALAPPPDLAYEEVTRAYRREPSLRGQALVDRLVDRLIDYKASVRLSTATDLPQTIADALSGREARRMVVPVGLPGDWLQGTSVELLRDDPQSAPLSVADLDSADGVLTGCAVAIAETGTLVLDASADQGRRAITLVPDYHLCVLPADRIVSDVPEALARLDPSRLLTFISGPSATSDIELKRVEGVHGPRTLDVIVVARRRTRRARSR